MIKSLELNGISCLHWIGLVLKYMPTWGCIKQKHLKQIHKFRNRPAVLYSIFMLAYHIKDFFISNILHSTQACLILGFRKRVEHVKVKQIDKYLCCRQSWLTLRTLHRNPFSSHCLYTFVFSTVYSSTLAVLHTRTLLYLTLVYPPYLNLSLTPHILRASERQPVTSRAL